MTATDDIAVLIDEPFTFTAESALGGYGVLVKCTNPSDSFEVVFTVSEIGPLRLISRSEHSQLGTALTVWRSGSPLALIDVSEAQGYNPDDLLRVYSTLLTAVTGRERRAVGIVRGLEAR